MAPTAVDNPLVPLLQTLIRNDVHAATRAVEALPEAEAAEIVRALPHDLTALILPHLQLNFAAALVRDMEPASFKVVVRTMEPKRAASLLMRLPPDALERLLPHAPKKLKDEARELLVYPEGSVGRIMHTDYLSFHEDERVRDIIRKIRKLGPQRYPASYTYVVDADERLVGVINMRDLLLADEQAPLKSIAKADVFHARLLHGQHGGGTGAREEAVLRCHRFVDTEQRMLGLVKAEQLIRGAQADVADSIQRMFGGSPDERAFSTFSFSLRKRLPWLHVNLATAFFGGFRCVDV